MRRHQHRQPQRRRRTSRPPAACSAAAPAPRPAEPSTGPAASTSAPATRASPAKEDAESACPAPGPASPPPHAAQQARRRSLPQPRRQPGSARPTERCRRHREEAGQRYPSVSARNATHSASSNRTTVSPINATASQLNRATLTRGGTSCSLNANPFRPRRSIQHNPSNRYHTWRARQQPSRQLPPLTIEPRVSSRVVPRVRRAGYCAHVVCSSIGVVIAINASAISAACLGTSGRRRYGRHNKFSKRCSPVPRSS